MRVPKARRAIRDTFSLTQISTPAFPVVMEFWDRRAKKFQKAIIRSSVPSFLSIVVEIE